MYVTLPPAVTVGGPDFTIETSADAVTVVTAEEELLPLIGSGVALETVAPLVNVVACAGAETTIVIVGAVAPAASAARVQDTDTFPVFVQAQPGPVADPKVTPAGSVSVTNNDAASDGPPLATTNE